MKNNCDIYFNFFYECNPLEDVLCISGDIAELGNFDDKNALMLETNNEDYPIWRNSYPLKVSKGQVFQYILKSKSTKNSNSVFIEEPLKEKRVIQVQEAVINIHGQFGVPCTESLLKEKKNELKRVKELRCFITPKETGKQENRKRILSESYSEDDFTFNQLNFTDEESPRATAQHTNDGKRKPLKKRSFVEKTKSANNDNDLETKSAKINNKSPKNKLRTLKESSLSPTQKLKLLYDTNNPDLGENYFNLTLNPPSQVSKYGRIKLSNLITKHDIIYKKKDDEFIEKECFDEHILLVALYLPLKISRRATDGGWEVTPQMDYEKQTYLSHLFSEDEITGPGAFKNLYWIGMVDCEVITPQDQAQLKKLLVQRYKCIPIFMESSKQKNFLESKYFEQLDALKEHTFNLEGQLEYVLTSEIERQNIDELNERYVDSIEKEFSSQSYHGYLLITDIKLVFIIAFFSQKMTNISSAIFFSGAFPSQNNFHLLPFNERILNAMLLANVIVFASFEEAQPFLSLLSMHEIFYYTNRGTICISYLGREIIVKLSSLCILPQRIEKRKLKPEYLRAIDSIKREVGGKFLVLGFDDINSSSIIEIKLGLLLKFFLEKKDFISQVAFYQIVKVQKSKSFDECLLSIQQKADEINKKYPGTVQIIPTAAITHEKLLAYYSLAKLMISFSIKSESACDLLEFLYVNTKSAFLLVSQDNFSIKRNLGCCVKVNPFNYEEFKNRVSKLLDMKSETADYLARQDKMLLRKNSSIHWLNNLITDVKHVNFNLDSAKIVTIKTKTLVQKIATNGDLRELAFPEAISAFKSAQNRLLLIDYEGTLVDYDCFSYIEKGDSISGFLKGDRFALTPSNLVLESLKRLTMDDANTVYIITGKKIDAVHPALLRINRLGIACEYGLIHRCNRAENLLYSRNKGSSSNAISGSVSTTTTTEEKPAIERGSNWNKMFSLDVNWKEIVRKVMEKYCEKAEGSIIELKESGVVWKYSNVCQEYGRRIGDELIRHLRGLLDSVKEVEVIRGRNYVEVRYVGISKGTMSEFLMKKIIAERGPIDFLFCAGDGISDEEMFAQVRRKIEQEPELFSSASDANFSPFLCSVGQRPSYANFYVRDSKSIERLLELLANIYTR